jgi:hypothetical protein
MEWSAHSFIGDRIQRKRPELRLIVSSATLEAQKLADFFNTNKTTDPANDTAAILSIEGSQLTSHVPLAFDAPACCSDNNHTIFFTCRATVSRGHLLPEAANGQLRARSH